MDERIIAICWKLSFLIKIKVGIAIAIFKQGHRALAGWLPRGSSREAEQIFQLPFPPQNYQNGSSTGVVAALLLGLKNETEFRQSRAKPWPSSHRGSIDYLSVFPCPMQMVKLTISEEANTCFLHSPVVWLKK